MNTNVNLAELIRRIQKLANTRDISPEELEELQFFTALNSVLSQIFVPGQIENLVPINLGICPIERAQFLAHSLGLNIVEGVSGTTYIGWSKGLYD